MLLSPVVGERKVVDMLVNRHHRLNMSNEAEHEHQHVDDEGDETRLNM
ncbi:hypothetical protein L195_g063984, partial [Trifolium pratense]